MYIKGTNWSYFYHSYRRYRFWKRGILVCKHNEELLGESEVQWNLLEKICKPARRLRRGAYLDFQSSLKSKYLSHPEMYIHFTSSYQGNWNGVIFFLGPPSVSLFCNDNTDVAMVTPSRNWDFLPLKQQPQSGRFSHYDFSPNKITFQPFPLFLPKADPSACFYRWEIKIN